MQDYHKLVFWQRAHALAILLDRQTRGFRRLGYADLRNQLTSAARSIGATIVEGCGAGSKRDKARFLDMALKSASETEAHLLTAHDLELIPETSWRQHTAELVEIRKMTYSYRRKIIASIGEEAEA